MADQTRPDRADSSPNPAPEHSTEAPPGRSRLRDRLSLLRAVIAVALASVIVGGLSGAALASVDDVGADGHHGRGRITPGGPGVPGGIDGGPPDAGQLTDRRGMGQPS